MSLQLEEKRKTLGAQQAAEGAGGKGHGRNTSVHLDLGATGGDRLPTIPGSPTEPTTPGETSRLSTETDNPFGDHARSSIGTFHDFAEHQSTRDSEFSFRSSHSTNIIPIAYIPPHSNSLSVDDANRGPYGESLAGSQGTDRPQSSQRDSFRTTSAKHASIPASVVDGDLIDIQVLPPALTPDAAGSTSAGGAPVRPSRAPGLDLELPKVSSPVTSPLQSPTRASILLGRPTSGFPFLTAPPPTSGGTTRGMSVLLDPKDQRASHLSIMSTATSRSGNSTMSYILDPPQIITPVDAQGIRKVEILGRGQAGLVHVNGSSAPSTPSMTSNSPTMAGASDPSNPFSDSNSSESQHSRTRSDETIKSSENPSRWTQSTVRTDDRASLAGSIQFDPMPPSPGGGGLKTDSAFFPQSARNSEAFDTGTRSRPLTGASEWSAAGGMSFANESRDSFASANSRATTGSLSMLDGIPFMASPSPGGAPELTANGPNGSPLFPLPPTRTPSIGPPSPSASFISLPPAEDPTGPVSVTSVIPAGSEATLAEAVRTGSESPLPAPFMPFAGQRPTSTASMGVPSSRVQSQAISVRTGFGSGLSDFPMQLGFPALDGGSERDSMASFRDSRMSDMSTGTSGRDSRFPPEAAAMGKSGLRFDDSLLSNVQERDEGSRPTSFASSMGGEDEEEEEPVIVGQAVRVLARANSVKKTLPGAGVPKPESSAEENPFADEQAVRRSSVRDSLADNAALALSFSQDE